MSSTLTGAMITLQNMDETLGHRVKRARKQSRLTQQDLADKVGIDRAAIALWENGNSASIKADNLFKVAKVLRKNPEWLLTGSGSEIPPASLREIIDALPDDSGRQALDYIQYRIHQAEGAIASDKIAHYTAMIEDFKNDLARRKAAKPTR